MITHTLTITAMKTTDEYPDHPDCVKNIEWSMDLTDGTNTATRIGGVNLPAPNSADYVPLANLTQQQVLTWVENTITNDGLMDYLKREVEAEFNAPEEPTLTTTALPWENA